MRYSCLTIPSFMLKIETQDDPDLDENGIVIIDPWNREVLAAGSSAGQAGVIQGDSRDRVQQLFPGGVVLSAREDLYQQWHQVMVAAVQQFDERVETLAWGSCLIESEAIARTFPDERQMAQLMLDTVQEALKFAPQIGVGGNPFTTIEAARSARKVRVVPAGMERDFLAEKPVESLPAAPLEFLRRLNLLGIRLLGAFAGLPEAAVIHQFGPEARVLHQIARGRDPRLLRPEAPEPVLIDHKFLEDPIHNALQLSALLDRSTESLGRRLVASGYAAERLALRLMTVDHHAIQKHSAFKPPAQNLTRLRSKLETMLEQVVISAAIESWDLRLYPLRPAYLVHEQLSLFGRNPTPKKARLEEAAHALRRRYGAAIVDLASEVGPPMPLPVSVRTGAGLHPVAFKLQGWRNVQEVYQTWSEVGSWWEQPHAREYFQVIEGDEKVTTLFHDKQGRWFLDRRRRV